GFRLEDAITPTHSLQAATAPLLVMAVPSHALRQVLTELGPQLALSSEIVLATKGLEEGSFLTVSQVTLDVLGEAWAPRLATLSGPTFAREIAAGEPAAVVVAARATALAAGGRRETLAGLAGLGDLVLTCTGELSRNRALGIALGQGQTLAQVQAA